ncbi:hypothetical protein [Celeribacter arenosi]|uniref:Lipoprotein n=1 Tax=Celeribacter arenosi TaxID=792649 RepID=A0ABP7K3K6_9RHOB
MRAITIALSLSGLVALTGCVGQNSAARVTVEKCVRAAGISGQYQLDYRAEGRQQSFTVMPTSGVASEQIAAANACIARAGLQSSATGSGELTAQDYVPELSGGVTNSTDTYRSCGTAVMVGGSGYCIKGDR